MGHFLTSVVILTSVTILVGLFIMGVFSGWVNVSISDITGKVDTDIQLIRSSLTVENIVYTADNKTAYVRNVGKTNIVITRVELVELNTNSILASIPSDKYVSKLLLLNTGDGGNLSLPKCSSCSVDTAVKLRIWYVAASLFNEANPELSAGDMSFVELLLKIPSGATNGACPPLSGDWLFLEFVDPVAYASSGRIAWDEIRVLSPLASKYETVEVSTEVKELESPLRVRTGVGAITTMTNEISLVDANAGGLYIPVEITLTPERGWHLLPKTWIFEEENNVHVSDITLTWDEVRKLINGAVLSIAKPRGTTELYEITVYITNCNGEIIAENSEIEQVLATSNNFITFVELPLTRIDQAYTIGTDVRLVVR